MTCLESGNWSSGPPTCKSIQIEWFWNYSLIDVYVSCDVRSGSKGVVMASVVSWNIIASKKWTSRVGMCVCVCVHVLCVCRCVCICNPHHILSYLKSTGTGIRVILCASVFLAVRCPDLRRLSHGSVTHPRHPTYQDEATYSCNSGYGLAGRDTRVCQADGSWSGVAPTCKSEWVARHSVS